MKIDNSQPVQVVAPQIEVATQQIAGAKSGPKAKLASGVGIASVGDLGLATASKQRPLEEITTPFVPLSVDPSPGRRDGRSVLIYFKHDASKSGESWGSFRKQFSAELQQLKDSLQQPDSPTPRKVTVLLENSWGGLKTFVGNLSRTYLFTALTLLLKGEKVPPYYSKPMTPAMDALVKIDIASMSGKEIEAFKALAARLSQHGDVVMNTTTNYQFKGTGAPGETTGHYMAFINPWQPPSSGRTDNQQMHYWLKNHGPNAIAAGIPEQVPSYRQLHSDRLQPFLKDNERPRYQGLSFETVKGPGSILKMSFSPSALGTNADLTVDEQKFTGPPHMHSFVELPLA